MIDRLEVDLSSAGMSSSLMSSNGKTSMRLFSTKFQIGDELYKIVVIDLQTA